MGDESLSKLFKKFNKLPEKKKIKVLREWMEINKAGDIVFKKMKGGKE